MRLTRHLNARRIRVAGFASAAVATLLGGLLMAMLPGSSVAAPAVAPSNIGEPRISGTPRVGEVLRTTRGSWTGSEPITYTYQWRRCEGRGRADASDCARISNAEDATYVVRQADVGFRIRSRVTATNDDGSASAASNPTAVITSARPSNTERPTISGTPVVGNRLTANRGTWVGNQPITYAFQWLRCNPSGDNCAEIVGANDNTYVLVENDFGRTLRIRVTARNDAGVRSAVSDPTAEIRAKATPPPPPTGNSVPVESLKAAGDRLVVSQVRFSPNPVTSRTRPIIARVRVTNRDGRAVRGALVFMRATPRVVRGDTRATAADGWVTLTLVPNRYFPQPRDNFNVQFFLKAYRAGDPPLGGIAGYRLVQVGLAG
jgi:hypothetical protein